MTTDTPQPGADAPNPLTRLEMQRCTRCGREFSDNNGVCPICGKVSYGGGNRDEVYLSDRWCLMPGPSAPWDRCEFSEAFSALAKDFLASPDAVLDFLLNVSNPDSGYIRNPFGELRKKLADLRDKASREEEPAVGRHCANLEKQCGYLLNCGGDGMSAILRVDAARLDKNGCTGVILEARSQAYEWLKTRTAEQSATQASAETAGPEMTTSTARAAESVLAECEAGMAVPNPFAEYMNRYAGLSVEWAAACGKWEFYGAPIVGPREEGETLQQYEARNEAFCQGILAPPEAVNTFDDAAGEALAALEITYKGKASIAWLDFMRQRKWKAFRGTGHTLVSEEVWQGGGKFGRAPETVRDELGLSTYEPEPGPIGAVYGPRDLKLHDKTEAELRLIDLVLDSVFRESAEIFDREIGGERPARRIPKVSKCPPPPHEENTWRSAPLPSPRIPPEPKLNRFWNAELRFPDSLATAIELAQVEACREFRKSVGIAPSREQLAEAQRVWLWHVFHAYGCGAYELVRQGTWKGNKMVTSGHDFFQIVASAADIKYARPEVDAELRRSPEWEQYEGYLTAALKAEATRREVDATAAPPVNGERPRELRDLGSLTQPDTVSSNSDPELLAKRERRQHGFKPDMTRHRKIVTIVEKHVSDWRTFQRYREDGMLKLICKDLDQEASDLMPESWKTEGKTPDALGNTCVRRWTEALEMAKTGKKLVVDQIETSLDAIRRAEAKMP